MATLKTRKGGVGKRRGLGQILFYWCGVIRREFGGFSGRILILVAWLLEMGPRIENPLLHGSHMGVLVFRGKCYPDGIIPGSVLLLRAYNRDIPDGVVR